MTEQKKWFIIIFFCFLAAWLFLFASGRYYGIANDYAQWVIEKGTYDWYSFPIMRAAGEIGYDTIGYSFFFIFPFILFFIALLFILFLALDFRYCNKWLFLSLITTGYLVGFVGFFVHDTPLFFLVSAYSFFYFKYVYKHQGDFLTLLLLNGLMFFTREIAFVIVPFTFLALVPTIIKPGKILYGFILTPTLYFPNYKAADLIGKTLYDLNASAREGINNLLTFHPANFFKYFNHPIFVLSFFAFFQKRDFHLAALIGLTFLYVYTIQSNPIFSDSIERYVLSFIPLHLFYAIK